MKEEIVDIMKKREKMVSLYSKKNQILKCIFFLLLMVALSSIYDEKCLLGGS